MPTAETNRSVEKKASPFLSELALLWKEMDAAYAMAAGKSGFLCTGCEDNCCRSLFFHHTLIEWLHLLEGLARLEAPARLALLGRAEAARSRMASAGAKPTPPGIMCPANLSGKCLLYPFRPMICRLHGISHRLQLPNGQWISGPGCGAFVKRPNPLPETPLDRTPFYRRLADLDQRVRQALLFQGRIKKTVAEMLLEEPFS